MKRTIALIVCIVMVISLLTACASSPTTTTAGTAEIETQATAAGATKGYKIGFANGYFGNTWRAQFVSDFEKAATAYKEAGIISDFTIANTDNDSTEQINQINAMLNNGIDALLICPVSPTAVKSVVDRAKEMGVKVVIANDPAAYEGTYCVAGNNYAWFDIQCKWMAEKINGSGNLVYVSGVPGNAADTLRTKAMEDVFAKYPNIKVLANAPGKWSQTEAQSVMTTMISTYGDQITGVLTQDVMAEGIIKAYANAGKPTPIMTGDSVKSFFKVWKDTPGLDSIGVPYAPGVIVTALDITLGLLDGKTFKDGVLEANPMDEKLINTIYVDPPYVVTNDGDQSASWMTGYDNTKAITLDKALEILADAPDTQSLDGWFDQSAVDALFK
jgi:ribose transport system substrate-binding protein